MVRKDIDVRVIGGDIFIWFRRKAHVFCKQSAIFTSLGPGSALGKKGEKKSAWAKKKKSASEASREEV